MTRLWNSLAWFAYGGASTVVALTLAAAAQGSLNFASAATPAVIDPFFGEDPAWTLRTAGTDGAVHLVPVRYAGSLAAVRIWTLDEDHPLARAGLRTDDVIVRLDGEPLRDMRHVARVLTYALESDGIIELDVVRRSGDRSKGASEETLRVFSQTEYR